MELLVYKASAGSGKTFTLAVEYIKHLIINPRAYKEILAVTFTNKATAEMKERILQQLYGIWKGIPASEAYFLQIQKDLTYNQHAHLESCQTNRFANEEIRRRAGIALSYMLHDYSHFRVETIDSFFQSVMRGLAHELSLSPNLRVELNQEEVLNDAVDNLIANLTPQSPVLAWLLDYIEERIRNDKRWSVTEEVKKFGNNIFNESYLERGETLRQQLQDISVAQKYRSSLRALENDILNTMKAFHTRFSEELEKNHLTENDFYNRSKGISSYFRKLRDGILADKEVANATLARHLDNADNWASRTSPNRVQVVALANNVLLPLLKEAENMRPDCSLQLNSCRLSLQHLNKLQLLNHISEEVRRQNQEQNRFLLSDTNALLHRLMQEGDSSFIFEKTGSSIRNVMIDEFQDTSRMQWDNFRLLLLEGLSQGADSLIVGDVKQSIYRWRNGDWRILNALGTPEQSEILSRFPIRIKTLKTNRRSEANIILFNNMLFDEIVGYLNYKHEQELGQACVPLTRAYADVKQESPKDTQQGYVKVQLLSPDEQCSYTEKTLHAMAEEVKLLIQQGIHPTDIAILVRKNKNIPDIAHYLEQELNLQVISDEAFRLDASQAVCILIDALRYLADDRQTIALYSLQINYLQKKEILKEFFSQKKELKNMPLYELTEKLYVLLDIKSIPEQDAYLFAFFDAISEYLQDNPSDIGAFLEYWDKELCNSTIPESRTDGIRILSIHKSKGLEYHTVLIPFCDWSLENERNDQLVWCIPSIPPYNDLELVPVSYSSSMAESIYRKNYLEERLQLWVDNLNLLYVACTRASKNLIIWSKQGKNGTMSELLTQALPMISENGCGLWDKENATFSFGKIFISSSHMQQTQRSIKTDFDKQLSSLVNRLKPCFAPQHVTMHSTIHNVCFRQSNRSADFIAGINSLHFIDRGRMLHTLFSAINTTNDIDAAINQLIFEGLITSLEEEQKIRELTSKAFVQVQVADWFSGQWKLLNERDIIWTDNNGHYKNCRPDRVMWKENQMVVVDFKFGKPHAQHSTQVKRYVNLLKQMDRTSKQITGFLWYVDENRVEQVC